MVDYKRNSLKNVIYKENRMEIEITSEDQLIRHKQSYLLILTIIKVLLFTINTRNVLRLMKTMKTTNQPTQFSRSPPQIGRASCRERV